VLRWSYLPDLPYADGVALQEATRADVLLRGAEAERLLLCTHPAVLTLGRSADPKNVTASEAELAARGVTVVRTGRGGDVTAHGPGQLVIYPVVRLVKGVTAYMEAVAGAIVAELAARGVAAAWRRQPAGVWAGEAKIAACGVEIKRRIATHGFALNVSRAALEPFRLVVPCGLAAPVTCLEDALGGAPPALQELAESLAPRIATALGRTAVEFRDRSSIVSCDHNPSR
jgi:lipoyl(octanoyl) transferase